MVTVLCGGVDRDFGLRVYPGLTWGIDDTTTTSIGVEADYYFLSECIRMNLGMLLLYPDHLPAVSIYGLGLEWQYRWRKHILYVGADYQKPSFQSQRDEFSSETGWGYYLGYTRQVKGYYWLLLRFDRPMDPYQNNYKLWSWSIGVERYI